MKAIICYHSFSGNTEEVAEIIENELSYNEIEVDLYQIGYGILPVLSDYDIIFVGSFTWDKGETPWDVKDFVADIGYKPENVYVFGTGETQFGGDALFCLAAEKLAKFYNSPLRPLKIEQSPRGTQTELVKEWAQEVMINERERIIESGKDIRATVS